MTKILPKALLISWVLLILSFSYQDGPTSSDMSSSFTGAIIRVIEVFEPDFQMRFDMDGFHSFVRGLAHFGLYLVLGVFAANMFHQHFSDWFRVGVDASLLALIVAIGDEMFQSTVPGRAMTMNDVFIDTLGAVFGVSFYLLVWFKVLKVKS